MSNTCSEDLKTCVSKVLLCNVLEGLGKMLKHLSVSNRSWTDTCARDKAKILTPEKQRLVQRHRPSPMTEQHS